MLEILIIILNIILVYTFLYPIVMSIIWIIGSIAFEIRHRKKQKRNVVAKNKEPFTIVIPVYNEGEDIYKLLTKNLKLTYPNLKYLIINDCSTDNTRSELDKVYEEYHNIKDIEIMHLEKNVGKASVLNIALDKVSTKFMVVVDSDTLIYPDAMDVLNTEIYNEADDRVVAYTGNMSIDQSIDNNLLRIQRLEYRSIIGMIKRAQCVMFHNIMTVSGAITCFNVNVIKEIGYFETKNATEDIEITWRISRNHYHSRYLSNMNVEITSPLTKHELLKQRERWTLGGIQTILQNLGIFKEKGHIPNKAFVLETLFSSLWIITFFITSIYLATKLLFAFPSPLYITDIVIPTLILIITSSILLITAYIFDKGCREYADEFLTHMLYYPIIYWFIQPAGFIGGLRDYLTLDKNKSGLWRKQKKRSIKKIKIIAFILDVFLFMLIGFIWKMIVHDLVVYWPNTINSVYIGVMLYWIGTTIFFYTYILSKTRNTFGEDCLGIHSFRNRNIIQNTFSVLSIGFLTNYYINFGTTLSLLNETDYYKAIIKWEFNTQQGNGFELFILVILVVGILDKYFGISEKIFKNKIIDK